MDKVTQEQFNIDLAMTMMFNIPEGSMLPTGHLVDKEEYQEFLKGCVEPVREYHGLSIEEAKEYLEVWKAGHRGRWS